MKTVQKFILLVVVILIVSAVVYFRSGPKTSSQNKNNKLQVTASFYPLYFFASRIGGDKAEVRNITPSGAEPHDYEPTAQDIAHIETSNLLILNGGKLEAWGDKLKDNLQGTGVKVITVGEDLANQQVDEDGKTIQDPHVWLSPPLAEKEVQRIEAAFIQIDPADKHYYQTNTEKLLSEIGELDKEYRAGLKSCQNKNIITSHAAFGYLSTAYDLHQVPIAGLSPDEEPSAQKLAAVADFAKKNEVHYIFFESLVSPKLSQTIAQEIGAQTLVLDPIEGVSDSDMKAGKNYLTIMKDNLKNLEKALQCQ